MQAVILVGGFGTRLRPLTFATPKPLLPIANVRQLEHLIAALGSAGVTRVVLALGFKPEPFFQAFPDGTCAGVDLHYAVEPEPLDTAGAVGFAARDAGIDGTFIVMNGDILSDLDLSSLVAFHRAHGAEGTLHLTPVDDPSQYGVVETDADGWVRRFVEKPQPGETQSRVINAGTYVLEPSVLDRMPPMQKLSIERVVFPAMVADGCLAAMATDDYWIDTGRPEPYRRANLDMIDGVRRHLSAPAVEPGARVHADATVVHSLVSTGATVGAGARVADSVILPGAVVSESAHVTGSIVMGHVGSGARIHDTVVGREGRVPDGAEMTGAFVPQP